MDNNSKAIKSGVWYTSSNFLIRGISFITTPIFSRLMTKSDFGLYSNFVAISSIIAVIVSLRLEASLVRGRFDYKEHFDDYVFSITVLSSLIGFSWLLIVNITKPFFSNLTNVDQIYLNIMTLTFIFQPAITFFMAKQRYEYKYKLNVFISFISAISVSLLSVILVKILPDKYYARVLGGILPVSILGLFIYIIFIREHCRVNFTYWKYAIPVSLPSVPHVLSMTILNDFDRIMITKYCGSEDNALYSIAYSCVAIVTIFISSINSAYSPWLGDNLHKKNYNTIRKFSKYYFGGFAYLTTGIILIAPEILLLIGGKPYMEAKYVMPPVIVGCYFKFVYTTYVSIEQYSRKTIAIAFGSIIAATLNYILNLIFIPKYGYIAAAYTTLIGLLFMMIYHIIVVKIIGYDNINDRNVMILTSVGMLIITIICNCIYEQIIIRYCIVFIFIISIFIFGIINRKQVNKIIKMIIY